MRSAAIDKDLTSLSLSGSINSNSGEIFGSLKTAPQLSHFLKAPARDFLTGMSFPTAFRLLIDRQRAGMPDRQFLRHGGELSAILDEFFVAQSVDNENFLKFVRWTINGPFTHVIVNAIIEASLTFHRSSKNVLWFARFFR